MRVKRLVYLVSSTLDVFTIIMEISTLFIGNNHHPFSLLPNLLFYSYNIPIMELFLFQWFLEIDKTM